MSTWAIGRECVDDDELGKKGDDKYIDEEMCMSLDIRLRGDSVMMLHTDKGELGSSSVCGLWRKNEAAMIYLSLLADVSSLVTRTMSLYHYCCRHQLFCCCRHYQRRW